MISTPSACIVAEKEKVAKVVLMPGDPLRAKYIAEKYLENPELFNITEMRFPLYVRLHRYLQRKTHLRNGQRHGNPIYDIICS